ncbi:MAG: hypothetical protein AAF436_09590 [Myxococcota bacterium]
MRMFSCLLVALVAGAFVLPLARADLPQTQPSSPYIAGPDEALLVFVRPRKRLAEEVLYSVVNARGECIAVLGNDWKVVAPIRGGKETLMVVSGVAQPQVQLLEVRALQGRTYVIQMRPRLNRKAPVDLTILRREEQPLEAFPATVLTSNPFRPNLAECSAFVSDKRRKLSEKAAAAKKAWNEDQALRERQTVVPGDGWPANLITP